ncbi:hypothetical protein [Bosea sp. FBZP-16]|uniref:hypothetical protein n=1 Tax=Bosea sp. FBZP-16 TaxID=2065382 RepID=UPI00131A355C|nr:hypothetical protein [Bosea sp. FBZP-16]
MPSRRSRSAAAALVRSVKARASSGVASRISPEAEIVVIWLVSGVAGSGRFDFAIWLPFVAPVIG